MTISSASSRNDYIGNGNVDDYDFDFLIFAATDLRVSQRDSEGDETLLVLNTDYSVDSDGIGNPSGGSIHLFDGNLPSGETLSIRRVRPITQVTDIRNQGDFYPETHEDVFDHVVMICQQQQDEIDRSVKLAETVDPEDFDAILPADIEDHPLMAIIVNAAGTGFDFAPLEAGEFDGGAVNNTIIFALGARWRMTTPDGAHVYEFQLENDGNFGMTQIS